MAKTSAKPTRFSQAARNRSANHAETARDTPPASAPELAAPTTGGSLPTPVAAPEPDIKTIALKVDTATGKWLVDRARPDTVAQLRSALDSDAARAALGGAVGAPASDAAAATTAAMVGAAFVAIGKVAAGAAMKRGFSEEAASKLGVDREDLELLTPAALAVLAKYNLLGGKYAEELQLLGAVVAVGAMKIEAMQTAEALIAARTTGRAS